MYKRQFLGQVTVVSELVSVVSSPIAPVKISGPSSLSQQSASALTLTARADSSCVGALPLIFAWKIYKGTALTALASSSKDPRKLSLPANALAAGHRYTAQVSVVAGTSSAFSEDSVSIFVADGKVVPFILGGAVRSVSVDSALELDGSNTYDENAALLTYEWSCVYVSLATVSYTHLTLPTKRIV